MRYYKIEIDGGPTYTSFENGQNIRGALHVDMDIPVAPFSQPMGSAYVKVWGIPLKTISQASDFNRKGIKVYGGMQKGLPLADPAQSGLLVQGWIYQCFGNWIGTDQSLDIIIVPGDPPAKDKPIDTPKDLILNWKKGQPLSEAMKSMLTTAYSGFTADINISSKLVALEDAVGYYSGLYEVGRWVKDMSRSLINQPKYQGVEILLNEKKFTVYDGTTTGSGGSNVKNISFKDLIGQPTWILSPSIQFKCAMRADLKVGDQVKLPPTLVTNSAQAQSSLVNQRASFQGNFQISSVRHVGSFLQPDAYSWVSTFDAFPMQTEAAS